MVFNMTEEIRCPRCHRNINVDHGYDGEGGVDYCCEYAFYWSLEWTVKITKDNQRSFDELQEHKS